MPTFLERFVGERSADLDEKARAALQSIDGVSSLSILSRLHGSGDQVRNPSAFVATAVKTAQQKGGPGLQELERAGAQLKEDGIIDEKTLDMLQKSPFEAGCSAIAGLLSQDESKINNTSAYVTRNISNASKGGGKGGPVPSKGMWKDSGKDGYGKNGYGMDGWAQAQAYPNYGPPPSYAMQQQPAAFQNPQTRQALSMMMQKWGSSLDQKAESALQSVSPESAVHILKELDGKADQVRNPSAYICRAVSNAKDKGQDSYSAPDSYCYGGGGCGKGYFDPKGCGGCKGWPGYGDAKGYGGPMGGPPMSFAKGKGGGGGCLGPMPMKGGMGKGPDLWAQLDHSAQNALYNAGEPVANAILGELSAKGSQVRNPSAYVVRAVEQAKNGQGVGGEVASMGMGRGPHTGGPSVGLDESAQQALDELPRDVAANIMSELESKMSTIRNPSAYVKRSAENAKKGKGCGKDSYSATDHGGHDMGGAEMSFAGHDAGHMLASAGEMPVAPLGDLQLDDKATAALQEIGAASAERILALLRAKIAEGGVQNPSAYVMKAVGNAKRGNDDIGGPGKRMRMGP